MTERPIYVDIDGTLTQERNNMWGLPDHKRIDHIRDLVESGELVVLWSDNGTDYATEFAEKHGLDCIALGKPSICIDDNAEISNTTNVFFPEEFF